MVSTGNNTPLAISRGSLVLVTGASGFVAAHIVKVFLQQGYRVRGTIRNRSKASFLSEGPFEAYAKNGSLELVDVPDMAAPGAYKEAIKGVSAVVNVATVLNLERDPEKVVGTVVDSMTGLLRTAAAEPSVRRFVHCSTIGTIYPAGVNNRTDDFSVLTKDSWNDESVELAYNRRHDVDDKTQGLVVYQASKVLAEKAAWRLVNEEKPGFIFNTIHPWFVFGPVFSKAHLSTSPGWFMNFYNGGNDLLEMKAAHVHVEDIAVLHFAATVDPDVRGERIIASVENFNWNTILALLRRMYPDRKFRDDIPGIDGLLGQTYDDSLPVSLLKKWAGRGWISLEQSIRDTIDSAI